MTDQVCLDPVIVSRELGLLLAKMRRNPYVNPIAVRTVEIRLDDLTAWRRSLPKSGPSSQQLAQIRVLADPLGRAAPPTLQEVQANIHKARDRAKIERAH